MSGVRAEARQAVSAGSSAAPHTGPDVLKLVDAHRRTAERLLLKQSPADDDDPLWAEAVKLVEDDLSERRRLFLDVRRRAARRRPARRGGRPRGRPAWVVWTQVHFMNEPGGRFLSERTVRSWWAAMVSRTVAVYAALLSTWRTVE